MRAKNQPPAGSLKKSNALLTEELKTLSQRLRDGESVNPSDAQGFSSAHLLGLLEVVEDAIISTNEEFRIKTFNQGAEKIFGWTFDEVVGHPINVLLPENEREIHHRHMEEFSQGEVEFRLKSERADLAGLRKNGEIFPAEASISKVEVEGRKYYTVLLRDITERKSAEEALLKSQRLLRSVIDSVPHTIVLKDLDSRYLMVNKSWCDFYGVKPEDAIHIHSLNIPGRPEYDKKQVFAEDQLIFNGDGQPKVFEHTRKDYKGRTRYFQNISTPINNENGEIEGLVAIALDVTEQKQAEEELRASHRLLQTVFDAIPTGIFIKDMNSRFVMVNRAYARPHGLPPEKFIGLPTRQLNQRTNANKERSLEEDRRVLEHGEQVEISEVKYLDHDGMERWRNTVKVPLYDDGGKITGLVGVMEDITERKNAEEDLRLQREIAVNMAEGVVLVRAIDTQIVYTNPKFEDIFGYEPGELIGQSASILYSQTEISPQVVADEILKSVKQNGYWAGEVNNIKKDGSQFWCQAKVSSYVHPFFGEIVISVQEDITVRKLAENALQQKTSELNSILNSLVDGVISICEKGTILTANPAAERIFGYVEQELIGQNVRSLMPEPYHSEHDGYLINYLTTGEAKVIGLGQELTGKRKDGTEFSLDLAISEITTTGNYRIFTGIVRDITDRKIAKEELTLSQSHLMSVFDNSPNVIILKDLKGRYKIVNRRFEEWFGFSNSEINGKTSYDFFSKEVANKSDALEKKAIETKQVISEELEIPLADGGIITVCRTKFPVLDSFGQVVEVGTITADITAYKKLEERLRRSQQILQTVFDSMPHLIFVRDTDSRYLMVNKALADRAGKNKEHIIGKRVTEISSSLQLNRTDFLEQDRRVIENGEAYFDEGTERALPNGEIIIERSMVAPFRNDKEEIIGIFGIIEDVTAQRKTEVQLRRAQKMEAIGVLAGGIAHDFNNILQPILTFSDILMSENSGAAEERQYAERIFRSANRGKDLVAQILLYCRQGNSSKTLSDLSQVTKEVVELARSTLPKSTSIKFTYAEKLPRVMCDPSQVHQVLLNLCVNAGHAIRENGEIIVSVSSVELKGMYCVSGVDLVGEFVRMAVSDNGVGMDEETLGKIFDPFFTTKGVGEGTGMGLSSALGIVLDFDGGIVVSTKLGKGTTFEVFLPVFEEHQEKTRIAQHPLPE